MTKWSRKRNLQKKYCVGCRDNFYNGNNPYDIQDCWCLQDVKVEWLWQVSIWTHGLQKRVRGLACWRSKEWLMCKTKYYK